MKNVLLVFGGKSYEHDISVVTASQIYNKTKIDDIHLVIFYVSRDNRFYVYGESKIDIKDFAKNVNISKNKKFKEVFFVSGENQKLFIKTRFGLKEFMQAEYAIIACHGGLGENGKLVSFLELFGIYSSASSFDSLAVCMNKFLFKQTMRGLKIPVVRGFKINFSQYEKYKDETQMKLKFMKFPVVIKSNSGGSSIGLFVAKDIDEFHEKLKSAFEFDEEILVESYIENSREFNVAIVGNSDEFEISEIDEPLKEHEILSFADKYLCGMSKKSPKLGTGMKNSMESQKRRLPADISESLRTKIQKLACKIFKSLELSGVIRIDFLYSEETDKLYVCEINTIPGSLAFYFFKQNKILSNDLVEKLIQNAERNKEKSQYFNIEFSTNILE